MPTTKARGKSAANSSAQQSASGSTAHSSLLKIESVIPALSKKHNKSIYRSYSTLSSGYFKKPNESKSDSQKNGTSGIQNGFWKINRTSREKEKLPDRINLDRRGLTALPIIEDEPNLRLLSLQHNLINSFYVPANQKPSLVEDPSLTGDSSAKKLDQLKPINQTKPSVAPATTAATPIAKRRLLTQKSMTSRTLKLINNQPKYNPPTSPLGFLTNHQNLMKNSFVQRSVLLHAKEKHIFKRANSFINNYSHQLPTTQAQRSHLMMQSRLSTMSSFSIDSTAQDQMDNGPAATAIPQKMQNLSSADSLMIKNESSSFLEYTDTLQNLVFLDLYDNQIEKISSLDGLKSLTVLLLGKNRISDITGIVSVRKTLRVLDLHGNKIVNISQKIAQLQELKSLNLAGNCLKIIHADDFKGLIYLRELNLKRNKIKKILGFDDLRSLERLWLCHNDLQKVEDMSSIAKSINLKEVTIENNPVSLGGDCVSFLVSYLPNLALLSQMQVTDQVRRAAMAWRKNKEISDANYSHLSSDVCHNIRREEVISNARTNWELLRSQQQINKSSSYIQKSIRNTSQQLQVPVAEIEVDIYGTETNLTTNNFTTIDQRKLLRQKTFANRATDTKRTKTVRGKRSLSQENIPPDNTAVVEEDDAATNDFFRLPPILAPFLDQSNLSTILNHENSSTSSLGPNVDSSSSLFSSSDTEDGHRAKNKIPKPEEEQQITNEPNSPKSDATISAPTVQIEMESTESEENKIPTPSSTPPQLEAIQTNNEILENETKKDSPDTILSNSVQVQPNVSNVTDEDNQSDKTSNLSTSSIKTESSTALLSDDSKTQLSKSRNPSTSRKLTSPLIRSQTTKTHFNYLPLSASTFHQNQQPKVLKTNVNDREREQGGDYLIEICGRYLNVYGAGAIKFIDRQWNTQKANDVHTFKFSYVNFNAIATILNKIKTRFPNAENFVFRETNINNLGQLNALAEIQGITSLVIDPEGNQVCTKNWRSYAIYRLSHWGIKSINGVDVTEEETEESHKAYVGLSDLVLWSLPETLLEPLLTRLRLDETCLASKMTAKQWLMQADPSLKIVVGKEALQSKKSPALAYQDEHITRQRGRNYFSIMMENTCNAVEKLQRLEQLWPNLLVEMIRNTLLDYSQIDVYVKNLMSEMQQKPS